MRKRGEFVLLVLILILIVNLVFIAAAGNSSSSSDSDKIEKARDCLKSQIANKTCDKLSTEEKVFSVLSVDKCKSELEDDSDNNECWSNTGNGCDIKTTAQAILALNNAGSSTTDAENWLIAQNSTPSNMEWYLQLDTIEEPADCTITYSGSSHSVTINEDKTLSQGAGSCLTLTSSGYWLKISDRCYSQEFEISCNKGFISSLLFKKSDSSVVHVLNNLHSASAEGITTEKVNSLCFSSSGGECDYEGSLWAALVLKSLDYDVSPFIPYLVTMADEVENGKYLPEAFLNILTGDFRDEILLKQKFSKYWDESGDKFYDTALALLPFQYETPPEKSNSINWLLEPGVQDDNGCWKGNLRNTGFLLYSIWPSEVSSGTTSTTTKDCEDSGNYCMLETDCRGKILPSSEYSCSSFFFCCDTPKAEETCSEKGGEICTSNQECASGYTENTPDLDLGAGEECCIDGYCRDKEVQKEPSCVENGGVCEISKCGSGYEISYNYECDNSGDICCIESSLPPKKSKTWIYVLGLLIILVVLGIIFRNKLRPYIFRIKSMFKGSGRGGSEGGYRGFGRPPGFPPAGFPAGMRRRIMPRRVLPSNKIQPRQRPLRKPQPKKSSKELDDVLKKLKEMGS